MALTPTQAVDARKRVVSAVFGTGTATVTKPQIDTVCAAATTWLEANAASFVTALNGTVAQGQSAATMAAILAAVAESRYGGLA
jgi:hypothetical protein